MDEHEQRTARRAEQRRARKARGRRLRLLAVLGLAALVLALVLVIAGPGSEGKKVAPVPSTGKGPKPGSGKPLSPYPPGTKLVGGARARNAEVPILMYHVVTTPKPTDALPRLFVPEKDFKAHMDALESAGYTGITQTQMWNAWRRGAPIPRKPVVVSFDDGYVSQYSKAFPVLQEKRWPGVINVVTHNLGKDGITRHMLAKMSSAGWDIGAHTITHKDLSKLQEPALTKEIAGSKRLIERDLRVPVKFFCYPSGKYNQAAEQAVERAGFLAATTVTYGLANRRQDPFALDRVRVDGGESAETLMASLRDLRAGKNLQGPGGGGEGL